MTTIPSTPSPFESSRNAAAISKRTVPRATLSDLNAMDIDAVRERFARSRRDDRGPVERFLDLLDYPRNQIMSMAAPGLEKLARERGEIGAGGTGRVYGSDILNSLGVENRIARGVLGFAADVAFDPLTYLGPAGWGFKSANAAGQGVRVGLRGRSAIKNAVSAVAKSGLESVADPAAKRLFMAAAKSAPAGLDNAGLASHLSEKILGPVSTGRLGRAISRVGGETAHRGGILSRFDEFGLHGLDAEEVTAARDFIAEYGKGSAPGVRIGKDASGKLRVTVGSAKPGGPIATSTIAHIPFTEFGIHVPAFTSDGKAAADALRIATSAGRVEPVVAAGPTVAATANVVRRIEDYVGDYNAGAFNTQQEANDYLDTLRSELRSVGGRAAPAEPQNVGELLSLRRLINEGEAAADHAKASMEFASNPEMYEALAEAKQKYADAVRGSIKQFATSQNDDMQRIAKRILGTDDDVIGASIMTPVKTMASAIGDPGVVADIADRIDRGGRKVFGQPNGALRSMVRYTRNSLTTGAREAFSATEHALRSDIVGALQEAGIKSVTSDDYQKAANLTLAHMYKLQNKGDAAFFTKQFGSDADAEWVELLKKSQQDGFFSKTPAGTLNDRLQAVAARHVDSLTALGDAEYEDKILRRKMADYVPTVTTPEGKAQIESIREYAVASKRGSVTTGKLSGLESEGFQKPRSMWQYRYQDPETGGWRRFFEKDRWASTISDDELKLIAQEDPDSAKYVAELRDTIARYDALSKDEAFAQRFAPRSTDPWELNQLQRAGKLSLLTGAEPVPGGFADLNAATVMASRQMAHERAVAKRTWLEYAKQFGVAVDPKAMQGMMKDGETMLLKDGSEVKFFKDKNGTWGFTQLGQRYRGLSATVKGLKDNPLLEAMGDTRALAYHEDVANLLEDLANLYDKDPTPALRALDKATGAWKTATLFSPTWTIGNIVGDGLNYIMGGARATDLAANAAPMARIIANLDNPEALRGINLTVRGVNINGEQLVNELRSHRLLGNNRHAETALQLIGKRIFVMPSMVAGAEARQFANDFRPAVLKADFIERLRHESAAHRMTGVAKAAGFVASDRFMRRLIAPWFRANEKVSDYMRALAYLSFLEQGHDVPSAIQRTIRAGFDYADNTRVERDFFKRLFPFYSWMRLNGAYQVKQLLERPIYAGSFPLVQHAIEEMIAGDEKVPLHARPQWMRNQLAIMVGSDPESRQAILLGQTLPTEQALALGGAFMGVDGMQDFAKYFLTSVTPPIRVPAEFGAGREFYSGRTIGDQGDISTGDFFSGQFRPYREFGKIREAAKTGIGPAVTRLAIGGRAQPASDDRLATSRLREFTDEESRLRNAVRRADRKGDTAARVIANTKLLQLYADMERGGFEKEVPKWARERLRTMK